MTSAYGLWFSLQPIILDHGLYLQNFSFLSITDPTAPDFEVDWVAKASGSETKIILKMYVLLSCKKIKNKKNEEEEFLLL